ncbi:MAG: carbonic anhydrase [Geothrix sp.]|uniref:carbonic anhydrase n=1 Tax=Geothrix sp. TaxID=1962974 RepID=UPI00179B632D|nr:carbonic anhydrase [Geothrix sp.]NWJ39900.1 carbonic anhydrase [Geothrix sp.]WIL22088.1 MAG: carbonic anhydrase [Geothrix sp.]
MQKLVQGIHHFQTQIFSSHKELFERLDQDQTPETLFITCSDSRISPNLITQTQPGELFILRNVGNLIPPYESMGGMAAGIEFAVASLQVKDIIICGHSNCGAMKALLEPETVGELPATKAWLAHARTTERIIWESYGHLKGNELLHATVEENVLVQLENLRRHPAVAKAMANGMLHLHAWYYKIETGEVFAFDPGRGQYVSVTGTEGLAPLNEEHRATDLSI